MQLFIYLRRPFLLLNADLTMAPGLAGEDALNLSLSSQLDGWVCGAFVQRTACQTEGMWSSVL